ncbi:MAG: prolyl aminopeptidase [Gammaproteobacteria bacterium]
MRELYPEIEAFSSDKLQTDSDHVVYYEQAGNPDGIPVVFLHGGPGSGCNENHRRYFDPKKYRIILLDQRGCNRSTPNGHVENNTTQALIADIDAIRQTLAIDKWLLFGGSWGATLALLYAEQYPSHVTGMILRGSFLARQQDFDWFAGTGVSRIMPDYWHEFISGFEVSSSRELIKELHHRVFSEDKDTQLAAARAWGLWAGRVVTNCFNSEYSLDNADPEKIINEVRIEMHYAFNRYFLKDNQILENTHLIPKVPVKIIHGRQDLTCLPETSWLLHQAIHGSSLNMVKNTGHLAGETSMVDALVEATDSMALLLS